MKLLILFGLTITLSISCSSNKITDINQTDLDSITFTAGGGFAGTYVTYILFENGQIFHKDQSEKGASSVGKIPKDEISQIFKNYGFLDLDNIDQESYGNYTYSMTKGKGEEKHKHIWEKDMKGAETLQLYFLNVMNAIKTHKKSPKETNASKS